MRNFKLPFWADVLLLIINGLVAIGFGFSSPAMIIVFLALLLLNVFFRHRFWYIETACLGIELLFFCINYWYQMGAFSFSIPSWLLLTSEIICLGGLIAYAVFVVKEHKMQKATQA